MAEQTKKQAAPRFAVRTPSVGFTGVRGGIAIRDGAGETDSPEKAQACADLGYEVTDTTTAEVRNPLPDTCKRLEQEAAAAEAKKAAAAAKK